MDVINRILKYNYSSSTVSFKKNLLPNSWNKNVFYFLTDTFLFQCQVSFVEKQQLKWSITIIFSQKV